MSSSRRHPGPFDRARLDPAAAGTWILGFALVLYLALQGGGYDSIVRGEVGVAVWWLVLCGVASGALPLPIRNRAAVAMVALLAGFVIWTGLSLGWTASSERTANELARVATYLGFLVLALSVVADGERARSLLNGVTCAIGAVIALAVLSRLHPSWFPENSIGAVLPGIEIERRLAYPLNYSSAIGVAAAIAVPLLLGATAWARTIAGQALAAAAVPIAGFAFVLASSGTGTAALIVALAVFVALSPDRLPKLITLALGTAGAVILSAGLSDRPGLDRGLPTPEAMAQGDELLAVAIVVCLGVALAQTALGLAVRFGERARPFRISPRNAGLATGLAIVVAVPVAIVLGVPGEVSDGWENFKTQEGAAQDDRGGSLVDTSSSGRYQFWQSAAETSELDSLKGVGAGTFEFFWAQDPENFGFVRDAHSLYMENLAELGIVGFLLIVGLVGAALIVGAVRSIGAAPPARTRIAAATAATAAFAAGAALDWIWEIAALPAIFLLLLSVMATDRERDPADGYLARRSEGRTRRSPQRSGIAPRIAVVAVAVGAVVAIVVPLRSALDVRDSQVAAATGDLPAALSDAEQAVDAQPGASAPRIQLASVLELQGEIGLAVEAARTATEKEPVNWRNWTVLSRLEALSGNAEASVAAYRRARDLSPRTFGAGA